MKRHISFCILTFVSQVTSLTDFFNCYVGLNVPAWLEISCIYYFVFVSSVYAVLRLNEPVVWATFK